MLVPAVHPNYRSGLIEGKGGTVHPTVAQVYMEKESVEDSVNLPIYSFLSPGWGARERSTVQGPPER